MYRSEPSKNSIANANWISDNEVIDSGKSEKSGSISSKSSVSAEVIPDALTDERVFNEKDIPFTMISIEVK